MSSTPIDPQIVKQILDSLIVLFQQLGGSTKGDPTLADEFRCPDDRSSRTWKISEQLASRPRGHFSIDGKRASFIGGNTRLDELDPGREPRSSNHIFYFGIVVIAIGLLILLTAPTSSGC
jgi:hypothetical protein